MASSESEIPRRVRLGILGFRVRGFIAGCVSMVAGIVQLFGSTASKMIRV